MAGATAFGVAPLRAALLQDPLAFLSAEHRRQLALLAHLERLARAPRARGARVMAAALLRWLTEELPLHIADEEHSLYPRLRHYDAAVVERLSAERLRNARLAEGAAQGLRAVAGGGDGGEEVLRDAAAFARAHRHRLELEEATAMALSRRMLTAAEQADLAGEMARRRGLDGG
jgi:hemerythrin-like domain-containing protein